MGGIRARLVMLVLLLVGGALASVAVFSSRYSIRVIREARRDDEIATLAPLRTALLGEYAVTGWAGVRRRIGELAGTSGRQLLLTDAAHALAAAAPREMRPGDFAVDSAGQLIRWQFDVPVADAAGRPAIARQRADVPGGLPGASIDDPAGRHLGTLYYLPTQGIAGTALLAAPTYRPVAMAAGVIALVALLITLLLSRRVLGPIDVLTAAAGRMAAGDLSQRVAITGKDEIAALAAAFNSMADALVRTQNLRRAMTTDIAHELRTPLTNIRCTVESLADGVVPASPAIIASLQDEVQLLQRLIDDLQDLALADVGELRLRPQLVDAASEAQACVRSTERDAAAAGITLLFEGAPGLPPLSADRERVQQMLRNLLRNALTHTPPGGSVTVRVAPHPPDSVAFSVQDTGIGIAPEHVGDVFQRFFRIDPSRSRDTGGAGLGLAIVKGLAEAHGGRVAAASVPGKGSTFTITLPMNSSSKRDSPS